MPIPRLQNWSNLSAFLWARRLNSALSARLHKSLAEQDSKLVHRRAPWKTRESVELATLEWVAWYNHHRLMEPLGYIPPAEAEANYYRQLRNTADVPALT